MSADNESRTSSGAGLPVGALLALFSLVVAIAALWFAFKTHQESVTRLNEALTIQNQQRDQMISDWQKTLAALRMQQEESRGFMVRQHHYARLMQLLSDAYVLTIRLEPAALEEVHHRINAEFHALEPFLAPQNRDWLAQQLAAIKTVSTRLADPLKDYEENLLTTKTSLRNQIDEAHQKTYGMLFGGVQRGPAGNAQVVE